MYTKLFYITFDFKDLNNQIKEPIKLLVVKPIKSWFIIKYKKKRKRNISI